MTTRATVERVIRSAYAARVRGDLDEVMRHFTDTATFSLAGAASASPVPAFASGRVAVREVMRRLIEGFDFLQADLVETVVDQERSRAAVHTRILVRIRATGHEAMTELVDLLELEGDRIKSIRQFADTALIKQLLGA